MIELHNGDCFDVMPTIADKSIDAVIADLPYGTTRNKWDVPLPLDLLWRSYKRVLKETGVAILNADGIFTGALMMSNTAWFKYKLVWDKKSTTGFLNAKKMPLRRHEDILIFAQGRTTYNPIMEVRGRPRNKGSRGGKKCDGSTCYGRFNAHSCFNNTYYPTSIIEVSNANQKAKQHPTEKPLGLLVWLVATYTNERDIVLDNTMGCGGAGVACVYTNRGFIGIEKDAGFFKKAEKRINDARSCLGVES